MIRISSHWTSEKEYAIISYNRQLERNGTNMEHYYQPEIECASREQIQAWQDERLAKTVKRVYENVDFYKKRMDEKGIKPEDIQSVDDLHKLIHDRVSLTTLLRRLG